MHAPPGQPPLERPPPPIPAEPTPAVLRTAVQDCRACDLWEAATQGVMGEGADHAEVMLVGEQPGDQEDLQGHPFVGPAGRILDQGLAAAGIVREEVYITNVVKHFRYKAQGKRRIHQTPDRWQVTACLPWLESELAVIRPSALVFLGATAAKALLGSHIRIGRDRGQPVDSPLAELVTLTAHPSSILRADEADRPAAMEQFVADLMTVSSWLGAR